jgi:hypothetical protein
MRRYGLTIGILLGMAQVSMATALAEETCKTFLDLADKYSLGQIPIGAVAQDYLSREDLKACLEFPYGIDQVCDYTGEDGIKYEIWYDATDKPETATIARASTSDVPPKRPLLAGIELGDSMDTVLRKLKTLPRQLPEWSLRERQNDIWNSREKRIDIWLETGPCWRGANGTIWGYQLWFGDQNKLQSVIAFFDGYETPG